MEPFTIYPAIDLRNGNIVRLIQGDPLRQTIYGNDPKNIAQHWIMSGASWLHVVNLDGAFGEKGGKNWIALQQILDTVAKVNPEVQVQFGGGIRTTKDIENVFSIGVDRVILGTFAIQHPELAKQVQLDYGKSRLALAIDVRDRQVLIHGWKEVTDIEPNNLGKRFFKMGYKTCIYTNTLRDGGLGGIDIQGTRKFARSTSLSVIASGGLDSVDEIKKIRNAGLNGVIIGRALYEGKIKLEEALQC